MRITPLARGVRQLLATPRTRFGFTAAELLVGLVLLTIGLLGTAGTAAVLTRHAALAARAEQATALAVGALATLRAAGCAPSTGTQTDGPITVSWAVHLSTRSARTDVTVRWPHLTGSRLQSYSTGFLC